MKFTEAPLIPSATFVNVALPDEREGEGAKLASVTEVTEYLSSVPALEADDVPVELRFWQGQLGWAVTAAMGEPVTFARLSGGGAQVTLSAPMVDGAKASVSTLAAVYVEVDDVDALHDRLQTAGVQITTPLTTRPWGLRDFVARTPTGHLVAFGQRVG